jgi:hypothetical protein
MRKIGALIAGAAAIMVAATANATVYDFSYTGGGFDGSGTITTAGPGDIETITAISGTFDGMTISGLTPVGSCCSNPASDNLLYPNDDAPGGPAYLDYAGLSFGLSGSSTLYNLFYNPPYAIIDSNVVVDAEGGAFTLTAVPEPASWALMLLGFGAAGIALRGGRRQRATA